MGLVLHRLWAMLATFLVMFENIGQTGVNITEVGKELSENYLLEARVTNAANLRRITALEAAT